MEDALLAVIVVGVALVSFGVGLLIMAITKEAQFQARAKDLRQDSLQRSRSTLGGQFLQNLAPHFPDFPHDPTEVRFIGTPVDFVVFRGLSNNTVEEVIFLEVKAGRADLTTRERRVRDAVMSGRVRWEEYRTPEGTLPSSDAPGFDGLGLGARAKDGRHKLGGSN